MYLVTAEARFLKKKLLMGPMGLNQAQNEVFCHFIEFGSYVFLEIVYSDSSQQCPISSKGKPTANGTNWPNSGPKNVFSPLFLSFVH